VLPTFPYGAVYFRKSNPPREDWARDSSRAHSQMSVSCVVGGFPGLCLDCRDVRERAGAFLRTLVLRYRSHAGLGGL
jgi:hypothetical protein